MPKARKMVRVEGQAGLKEIRTPSKYRIGARRNTRGCAHGLPTSELITLLGDANQKRSRNKIEDVLRLRGVEIG